MSNFIGEVINPETGKVEKAIFIDTGNGYKIQPITETFTETFTDADYSDAGSIHEPASPLTGCIWLCGRHPVCSVHISDGVEPECVTCGHYVDCHETVRFEL